MVSPRQRRNHITPWLLIGPLLGGFLTHLWDLSLLNKYTAVHYYANEIIYAAEVAPRLEPKRIVSLDLRDETEYLRRSRLRDEAHDRLRKNDSTRQHNSDSPQENDTATPAPLRTADENSKDEDDCIPMHEWQTSHHPMCNYLHEMDFHSNFRTGDLEYIDSGGFNDLFHHVTHQQYHDVVMNTDGNFTDLDDYEHVTELAIKILSITKEYSSHNYQIVRQDAVIQERLTGSPYIFPIYGYCGFALVLPYVSGGTLSSNLRKWRKGQLEISSRQRLKYAVDMARGLRDLHDIDHDGVPSVTHGDLKEQQYLITDEGGLQLGDFNKGQFLMKHASTGKTCPYQVGPPNNDKVFRSPEEYAYKPQTAAGDVWALGSLMYYLLTGSRVWREIAETHTKQVRQYIIQGKKPEIEERILNSKHPVDRALKKAYDMACVYDMEERATAREVSDYLDGVWKKLGY